MNKIEISKPLAVANYHVLYDKKFLLGYLYDGHKSTAQFITVEDDIESVTDLLRKFVQDNYQGDKSTFDVLTSTKELYTSMLGEADITCHLVLPSETSETHQTFEQDVLREALIEVYNLKDPALLLREVNQSNVVGDIKSQAKWELILIKVLNKVTDFLNGITNKLN
ncbi:hypothetical protein IGI01_02400 [Bacillus thuringiensis]|nr:hypothetical protein [Bacillus thuringiensis]